MFLYFPCRSHPLVPEEEIILPQTLTSSADCLCVLRRLKCRRPYSLREQRRLWPLMVATEALQHSVHITADLEGKGKRGGQAACLGGLFIKPQISAFGLGAYLAHSM